MAGTQCSTAHQGDYYHLHVVPSLTSLKYDRIDPAEVQALKDQIEKLTTEKTDLEAAQATHQTAQDGKVFR